MVTIPRWYLTRLRLFRGDTVEVSVVGESVQFTPIKPNTVGPTDPAQRNKSFSRPAAEDEE